MTWKRCVQPSSLSCRGCWTECTIKWVEFGSFCGNKVYVPLVFMWKNPLSHRDFLSRWCCFCLTANTLLPCVSDRAAPMPKLIYADCWHGLNPSASASFTVLTEVTSDIPRDEGCFHHGNSGQTWMHEDSLCPSTSFGSWASIPGGNDSWKSGAAKSLWGFRQCQWEVDFASRNLCI